MDCSLLGRWRLHDYINPDNEMGAVLANKPIDSGSGVMMVPWELKGEHFEKLEFVVDRSFECFESYECVVFRNGESILQVTNVSFQKHILERTQEGIHEASVTRGSPLNISTLPDPYKYEQMHKL